MTEPIPMPLPQPPPNPNTRGLLATVGLLALLLTVVAAAILTSMPGRTVSLRHISTPASAAPSGQRTEVAASSSLPLAAALAGSPVTVYPRPGDGWISLTARTCGSSASWRQQQALNGGVAWLYLGRAYRLDCAGPTSPGAGAPANSGWVNPLPGRCTGSGYRTASRPSHNGIDIPAPSGTPVRAAAAGVAHHGYQAGGAGVYVYVVHAGAATTYFHLSSRAVADGAQVSAGQVIGYVGTTGNSTGPHLHYEVHVPNVWRHWVNPVTFMADHGARLGC